MQGREPLDSTPLGRAVTGLAAATALAGGLVLLAMIGVVLASVAGRALLRFGFTSIRGDYELVSAGTAVAAFAFLGWAQLKDGHAVVDLLVERFPARLRSALAAAVNLLVAACGAVLAWRLAAGALDKLAYGETTQLLRLPLVWPYAACALGAAIFALTALYCALRDGLAIAEPHP